jgi:hypothetical protein
MHAFLDAFQLWKLKQSVLRNRRKLLPKHTTSHPEHNNFRSARHEISNYRTILLNFVIDCVHNDDDYDDDNMSKLLIYWYNRSPLWSSSQSSWLHIQMSVFDSLCYQIFWEVVVLERGPLSLVSTTKELLVGKSSGPGLEIENTAVGIRRADYVTPLYLQKLALTSPTSGCRSICIVSSRTQATGFVFVLFIILVIYSHGQTNFISWHSGIFLTN